jgi:DNA helicase-2/ATP-dependent DNA helicase PcrA
VVAGAGTGKTAVIAERFRRLVASGVAPASILVMTFTERAAAEMRRRIEALIGENAPAVGTFHSIALGWLRADGRAVGVPAGFRIVTGADRWILARELMWAIGDPVLTSDERPDDLVAPLLQMLERLKQELVPLRRLEAWAAATDDAGRGELMRACVRLFRAYEKECRKQRLLDFDDLLLLAVRLFEKNPAVLRDYTARHQRVLVDEYQDLNLAQERLVELIAQGGNPFIVGDDDQSIYRFRGASRASLERFLRSFPQATTITLGRNRRSSRKIVAAAAALIGHNPDRLLKQLRSDGPGAPVEMWRGADGLAEASAIAEEASRLAADGMPLSAIAVLCRTNAIARPIASALAARGLPHVVTGGHGFLDRPEVKDLIAMLRVMRDPEDLVALARVKTRPAASALVPVIGRFVSASTKFDVRDLFFDLMDETKYLDVLGVGLEASERARASANVSRFGEAIAEFCETSPDHSLGAYMRHLDLVLLSGEDEETAAIDGTQDAIQVMTIHQVRCGLRAVARRRPPTAVWPLAAIRAARRGPRTTGRRTRGRDRRRTTAAVRRHDAREEAAFPDTG